jgi:hypothetical protein
LGVDRDMTLIRTTMAAVAALTIAACGGGDEPVADDLNESANASAMINNMGEPAPPATVDGSAPANAAVSENAGAKAPAAAIPAALHGRWGMTPADCTSTRGDAKGLLTIGPADLRFYESRAIPAAKLERSPNSISGDFSNAIGLLSRVPPRHACADHCRAVGTLQRRADRYVAPMPKRRRKKRSAGPNSSCSASRPIATMTAITPST